MTIDASEPRQSTTSAPELAVNLKTADPTPNAHFDKVTLVDSSFRYCEPCLKQFQAGLAASQSKPSARQPSTLSRITKYSQSTATSAMIRHLFDAHNIVAAKGTSSGERGVQSKLPFGTSPLFSSAKTSTASLNEDLVTWLARDTLAFSTVDSATFHALFQKHFPRVTLPSSDTLRLTTLPKVYSDVKAKVMDCLTSAKTICLMFDGWSDKHNARHFMGIRASVITEEWTSKVVTLSCKPCGQDANSISEHIATELADLGLTDDLIKKKVLLTTHDGASVMLKTSRMLNSKYCQHCCSHCLHLLIMTDGINKIPALRELISSCKTIVTKLHFKGDIVEQEMMKAYNADIVAKILSKVEAAFEIVSCDVNMPVENSQDTDGGDDFTDEAAQASTCTPKQYRRLQQEVVTRWNSALEMINSLLSLKNQVIEALKRTGHYDLVFKTLEWNTLSELAEFLESFKVLTEISSGNAVGLSIIPLIRAKVTAVCRPKSSGSDSEEITLLKRKVLARLDSRFPLNDFVKVATLLDPASKNKKYLNLSFEEKRDLLVNALRRAECGELVTNGAQHVSIALNTEALSGQDRQICSSTVDPEPKSKRLRILDEFEDEDSAADVVAMVTQYLSVNEKPSEGERSDPFMYWRNSRFSDLASLAKTYLTSNASSVPCESMFSISGMLLNGRRSSLAPHTFNRLIFIHDNY